MRLTLKNLKENFINDSESFLTEVRKLYSLDNIQLNWKPSADIWSIAECIEHLAVTNKLYIDEMNNQLSGELFKCDDSEEPVKHKFFGKMIIKAVDPSNNKKTKTFKVFSPLYGNYDKTVLDKLIQIQQGLINSVAGSVNVDFNKYVMSSPASKFVKENFCDVLEIIRLHNKRHLIQIEQLLSNEQFPD
uniref:DinB family protein n=1 Tax=Ignavibacterium album TaxID=591197 RepID=A0A7V3E6J0_9BACT